MVQNTEPQSTNKFGWFLGVFTPTILTILGVIMYLRVGWVVGNAGLWGAIAIVLISNAITFFTTLSMSTLATNMRVGVGGAYYLISRTLGLEVGGAIGIPLYLSQVLSITLYAFGLAESFRAVIWSGLPVQLVAAVVVIAVTLVAARSTELALKLQIPLMVLIFASIASLFVGADWGSGVQVAAVGGFEDAGFWQVFAVFFPAVTGILAGVSLSGDLDDPGHAIPRGALAAVGLGARGLPARAHRAGELCQRLAPARPRHADLDRGGRGCPCSCCPACGAPSSRVPSAACSARPAPCRPCPTTVSRPPCSARPTRRPASPCWRCASPAAWRSLLSCSATSTPSRRG